MNKIWRLIIDIRNFSYQRAIKQDGLDRADKEYKRLFLVITSGYVIALFFTIFIISLNFYDGSKILEIKKYPLTIKVLISMAVVYLPMKWVNHLLLKKVEDVPIPKEFNETKYNRDRILYWSVFLAGHFFGYRYGFPAYLSGINLYEK